MPKTERFIRAFPHFLFLVVFVRPWGASAQWVSQPVLLNPGWNAVFLEVQPEPRDCATLFAQLPIDSVWRFNRGTEKVQFIDDPNKLVPNQPDWLTYMSPLTSAQNLSTLFTLEGGCAYLVKVADGAGPVSWVVQGVPVLPHLRWIPDSLNLVGFQVPTSGATTFQRFLAGQSAFSGNSVYTLNSLGVWVLRNQATTVISRGQAFWIRANGVTGYTGTLSVETARESGVDFGRTLTDQSVFILNTSVNPATITLRELDSEKPTSAVTPALGGGVPLSYWRTDVAKGVVGWGDFPSQLIQNGVLPGQKIEVRLAVRRKDMAAPPVGAQKVLYRSILEITDGLTRIVVPVTADGR